MGKIELEDMVKDLYEKETPSDVMKDILNKAGVEEGYDVIGENLVEEEVFTKEMQDIVHQIIGEFPPLERQVITYRFGLDGNDKLTRYEIAKRLDTTIDKVRGAEERAIRRFKHPKNYIRVKDYLKNNEKTYHTK